MSIMRYILPIETGEHMLHNRVNGRAYYLRDAKIVMNDTVSNQKRDLLNKEDAKFLLR